MTHPSPKRNMVPKAILMRSGLVSLTTARPVNTAQPRTIVNSARPMTNVFNKSHSTVRRAINKNTIFKNSNFNQRVNTVNNKNVNAARPKAVVNAARPKAVLNAVKETSASTILKRFDYIDAQGRSKQEKGVIDSGCSRHMTGNMSYLTDYEEIDGGYVAFGGNPKRGKITGRGKFDGKADEGFFVGYSINSKAFRVFNSRTRIVEENLHVQFSENTPNIAGSGPNWLFDIDALTKSMNYKPVVAGNQSNSNAGTKACDDAGDDEKKVTEEPGKEGGDSSKDGESYDQEKEDNVNITNIVNAASINEVNVVGENTSIELPNDPNMPKLEDIVYSDDDEDVGAEADMNNLDAFMPVSPIPTTRIHKDHPVEQIIGDLNSAPQTRRMTKNLEEHGLFSSVQQITNHKDFQNCLFACLLSQEEPKKLPNGKKAIGTKWVFRNKKGERGIVIKTKARLVAQGYTQEEWIDYDEVFSPVSKIEAIRLFLAYASFKDFVVYQIDVNSAFLYMCRDDIIFGSTKKSLCTVFEKMMHKKFQMSSIGELTFFLGLQIKQKKDRSFFSQDKYVTEILKKFGFTDVKTASTPMETRKLFLKDEDGEEVDVHL
ncbi:putative ribonuclease H-like domain-containing protein [Tanacetum coccineum]|uniref:Ribonuclease H-like domain-containing protein n=1 Tax=Tanacetum coccineum TaxID=301880 RepID=A0ABQ4XJ55_9ASTR